MSNVVSIVNSKASKIDFDLEVDGLSDKGLDVRLSIKANKYSIVVPCKGKDGKWACDVPALEHLDKGTYKFMIEVIADGYYFEAMKGTLNVTGTHQVYAKTPEKLKPEAKKEAPPKPEKKVEKKPEAKKPVKEEETKNLKDVEKLADSIIKKAKEEEPLKETPKEEKKPSKDSAVRAILGLHEEKEEKEPQKIPRFFRRGQVISS